MPEIARWLDGDDSRCPDPVRSRPACRFMRRPCAAP